MKMNKDNLIFIYLILILIIVFLIIHYVNLKGKYYFLGLLISIPIYVFSVQYKKYKIKN